MIVDLVLAIARGTAELPSFAALFRVRLADPVTKRPDQFGAVRPKIVVVAGVRAQLVVRTVVLAHAARLARHVRTAKLTFVIAAWSIVAHIHEKVLAEWAFATSAMTYTTAY